MSQLPRVALVVPGFHDGGGVSAVAAFLHTILLESGRFAPSIVSVATSANDAASTRVLSPRTWFRGTQIVERAWEGFPFRHAGCRFSEFEFQRYRPRRALTRLLDQHDLIQVVAGSPAWAYTTRKCCRPVLLQVATLVAEERKTILAGGWDPWRRAMTRITARLDWAALPHLRLAFVENVWMQEALGRAMGPDRVVFAPPGIDTGLFHPDRYKPDGYLLSVGRWNDPRKNLPMLIQAYAYLKRARANCPRLILAGSVGPTADYLELARSLGVAEAIEVRTAVSRQALADLYREASVFVLSSDEEGLGLVILEAMASAIPVVSTRCGGPQTSVVEGVTGVLTPVGDSQAIAGAIGMLLDDPAGAQAMGEAGRRVVEARFSLAAAGRLFLDAYDSVLSDAGRSA